jgi:DNA-binding HxlR family transcriptional regulator
METCRKEAVSEAVRFTGTPAAQVINMLSTRWGVLTLEAVRNGGARFNELQRRLAGISHKVLIDTLRSLQRDGFIRGPLTDPRLTEYLLTPVGQELMELINEIRCWSEDRWGQLARARDEFDRARA